MTTIQWLIIIGTPVLIGLVIIESVVAKKRNLSLYTLSDSITNLYCGILERVFDIFFSVIVLFGFNYIHENIAPFQIEFSLFSWIIGLVFTDFIAYWFHRLSHEINFLWAAHNVHHQSEELNLTTVFRVSFLAVIYRATFFVWMAFAGFDVFTIVSTGVFLGLYQLFTHSRLIGKLGFIEKFMTTPSHHRVHHASNEKYLDQNYGHIFIIWDKLFGTFMEEQEEPKYGITSGYKRSNAYNAIFSYWGELFSLARKTKTLRNKINVFIKGPAYMPSDVTPVTTENSTTKVPYKVMIGNEKKVYLLLNVSITAGCFVGLLYIRSTIGAQTSLEELIKNKGFASLIGIVLISLFTHARLIENKKFAFLTDGIRLVAVVFLFSYGFENTLISSWLIPVVISYCFLMLLWLVKLKFNSNQSVLKT
jgi:sterol desaturase/sphingolipid hydroxylase (fatty acid hydroxylase superfamily)|tara:strand:+ start:1360 stop:2619 length:1260 start_codon:yes stop_codon:yes gene_type:complete